MSEESERRRLREEFSNAHFRRILKEVLGNECVSCGSHEAVEYHHIAPLALGGTNRYGNIVPLCHECHKKAHGARKIAMVNRTGHEGRPRKVRGNYKDTLDKYLHCEISLDQCKAKLGMGKHSKLTDSVWFKEYLDELGIKKYKNNLLIIEANGQMFPGREIGYIEYTDGRKVVFTATQSTSDNLISEVQTI